MRQELKLQRNGDLSLCFSTAIENIKINRSSIEEIKQVLRKVMIKIGLRSKNWPTDTDKLILIEHILKNYSNHTCEEIELAFDMAIAGKLDVEINCYENFSCLYFSTILSCYREWAKEEYKFLPNNEFIKIEEKKVIGDEEMKEWINEWKEKIDSVNNPMMIPPLFYEWLDKNDILKLSKEQKIDYATNKAVSLRQFHLSEQAKWEGVNGEAQKDLNKFILMRNEGCFTGSEVERLKQIAKKIAVFDYLKNKNYEMLKQNMQEN